MAANKNDVQVSKETEGRSPHGVSRSHLQQPGRIDIEEEVEQNSHSCCKDLEEVVRNGIMKENAKMSMKSTERVSPLEDLQEGPSGSGVNGNQLENVEVDTNNTSETNETRMERYGNYLERYGPHLERYGNQLDRFGNQLERIGPQLERCGSNLERYGPQLEAIGRQLERSSIFRGERNLPGRSPHIHTQTESGNEGYSPQSADSCQGSSSQHSERQGQWISQNSRRLSRRPSFQVNDGLIRHWIRRRNVDNRDVLPLRDDRRRSVWRNDGDLREFRRPRISSWRGHDNVRRQDNPQINPEENNLERPEVHQNRIDGNYRNLRFQRNEEIHQDDPNHGFVLIDHQNSPGPSNILDTNNLPNDAIRRPRSNMSLHPLNFLSPQIFGPPYDYNPESDEENNDQRSNSFGRRSLRRRDNSTIRSWVMMNNYFQPRPLYIGQGDSKAMDGPFTLQRIPFNIPLQNGNDRVSHSL